MKDKAIQWSITGVGLLCLAGVGVYLAQLFWLGIAGVDRPSVVAADEPMVANAPQEGFNVEEIQEWHLFGQQRAASKQPVVKSAPKTTLKLELLGVFLGKSGGASTAIIGEIGKSPESFKEGDSIASGVVLKEVHSDKVILSRNGRYETLAYAESTGGDFSSSPPSGRTERFSDTRRRFLRRNSTGNRTSAQSAGASAAGKSVAKSQLGRMVQSGRAFAPDAIVSALQEDLERDPEATIQDMGLVSTPGAAGYVIGGNAPKDLLNTVGLRVGDRIMSVDGQTISGGTSDAALIQTAMQRDNVRVEVQRGTRKFTVNVPVP